MAAFGARHMPRAQYSFRQPARQHATVLWPGAIPRSASGDTEVRLRRQ
jgi:hypothetical protein